MAILYPDGIREYDDMPIYPGVYAVVGNFNLILIDKF